ncbi:hypothetical protein V8C35DRAFT_309335 [Trichoderma chlorosporum]
MDHADQNLGSTTPPNEALASQTSLTRMSAIAMLEPWLTRARQEKYQGRLNRKLSKILTREMVQVMDSDTKAWLRFWATMANNRDVVEWVDSAKDDQELLHLSEFSRQHEAFGLLSGAHAPEKLLHDLLSCANSRSVPKAVRQRILTAVSELSYYVHTMATRSLSWASAELTKRLDAVRDAVRDEGEKTRDLMTKGKRTHDEAFDDEESDGKLDSMDGPLAAGIGDDGEVIDDGEAFEDEAFEDEETFYDEETFFREETFDDEESDIKMDSTYEVLAADTGNDEEEAA